MAYSHIAVIGAGAWGTALAGVAVRAGRTVTLVARDAAAAAAMAASHESPHLPGLRLDPQVRLTGTFADLAGADAILLAVPSQALRGVVRDVLRRVSSIGLPAEHHFYISINTAYPGVKMSEQLRSRYPKEITIVLQHQFWDFKVDDHQFPVTLSFSGVPEKLVVPFAAMTAFADPSVKFGLQFQQGFSAQDEVAEDEAASPQLPLQPPVSQEEPAVEDNGSAEIISIESFRKK